MFHMTINKQARLRLNFLHLFLLTFLFFFLLFFDKLIIFICFSFAFSLTLHGGFHALCIGWLAATQNNTTHIQLTH